jgi:hypothetical protein
MPNNYIAYHFSIVPKEPWEDILLEQIPSYSKAMNPGIQKQYYFFQAFMNKMFKF